MRCSVVFGVTLRLLVINVSSSSPAINITAYYQYQRFVTTCETVAVVHRPPCLQQLACCLLQAVKLDIGSESRFLPPHLHSMPPLGVPVGISSSRLVWKTRMVWLPNAEKILKISVFVLTECTNVTDTRTDRHTDGHRMMA